MFRRGGATGGGGFLLSAGKKSWRGTGSSAGGVRSNKHFDKSILQSGADLSALKQQPAQTSANPQKQEESAVSPQLPEAFGAETQAKQSTRFNFLAQQLRQNSGLAESEGNEAVGPLTDFARKAKLPEWARLIRLEKQTGTGLLLIPCFWGTSMGACSAMVFQGADWLALGAPLGPLGLFAQFTVGAWTMRSFGCVVNDVWDRDFDKQVERTKNRPLANGDLAMKEAVLIGFAHFALGGVICLSLPSSACMTAVASLPLVIIYPAMKRITHGPQVVLGMAMNWGVFVGYAAVVGHVDLAITVPLWIAGVCWTIIYDTIYAYQDVKDDEEAGVRSLTQVFGENKMPFYYLSIPTLGGFALSGYFAGMPLFYHSGIAMVGLLAMFPMIRDFNHHSPSSCFEAFRKNVWIGLYLWLMICVGNLYWVLFLVLGWEKYGSKNIEELEEKAKSDDPLVAAEAKLYLENDISLLTSGVTPAISASKSSDRDLMVNFAGSSIIDRVLNPEEVFRKASDAIGVSNPVIPTYMKKDCSVDNVELCLRWLPPFCFMMSEMEIRDAVDGFARLKGVSAPYSQQQGEASPSPAEEGDLISQLRAFFDSVPKIL